MAKDKTEVKTAETPADFALRFEGTKTTKRGPGVKADFKIEFSNPKRAKTIMNELATLAGGQVGMVEYLLENGYNYSMSAAGGQLSKEDRVQLGDAFKLELVARWKERHEAILQGGPSGRTGARGPRAVTLDSLMIKLAKGALVAKYAKDKSLGDLPKGEELAKMVTSVIAKNEAKLRPVAQRQLDELNALNDVEV